MSPSLSTSTAIISANELPPGRPISWTPNRTSAADEGLEATRRTPRNKGMTLLGDCAWMRDPAVDTYSFLSRFPKQNASASPVYLCGLIRASPEKSFSSYW